MRKGSRGKRQVRRRGDLLPRQPVVPASRDFLLRAHVAPAGAPAATPHVRAILRQTDVHRPSGRGEASLIVTPERACVGPVC
eukprot:scaffold6570_cov22-Phaeocystis_antarctica.AAC.1